MVEEARGEVVLDKETEFRPASVAIVLTTYYPQWYLGKSKDTADVNKTRGDLAIKSIEEAQKRGYRVVVADYQSSGDFLRRVKELGPELLSRVVPDRDEGRRVGIKKAGETAGVEVIVRTEPEKVSLIEDCIPTLALPILKGEAEIVVPKREERLFAEHYPDYMYRSEIRANAVVNSLLHRFAHLPQGETLDLFFGPTVLANSPEILALFDERYEFDTTKKSGGRKYARPENWSNVQMFPVVKALVLGHKVASVEVPFKYSQEQKENETDPKRLAEFKKKRDEQRWGILTELLHFVRLLNKDPKSLLRPKN